MKLPAVINLGCEPLALPENPFRKTLGKRLLSTELTLHFSFNRQSLIGA